MLHNKLVIPDFHERVWLIPKLRELIDQAERIIALGDWFDTFLDHRREETLDFLLSYADDPRWTWLIGNHDASYMFKHHYFQCSGWDALTQHLWDTRIPKEFLAKWKIWTQVDDFLVSHAGFHPKYLTHANAENHERMLQVARDGGVSAMWLPGEESGGPRDFVGGPNWMRWQHLQHVQGKPQIVGHTPSKSVQAKTLDGKEFSWNLDTHLHHVGWVEGNQLDVEAL